MDWIYIALLKAPTLYIEPIINSHHIHTEIRIDLILTMYL